MFTEVDAKQILKGFYGSCGSAQRLPGESDLNFHIQTDKGKDYLLKISQEKDSIINMQNDVLTQLQACQRTFLSPVLQSTLSGLLVVDLGLKTKARLLSYLPGSLLVHVKPHSNELLASLGTQIAHLSLALQEIEHPAAKRSFKWDLQQASWIEDYLSALELPQEQHIVKSWLKRFKQITVPKLQGLRQCLIHGDLNDYNVLVAHETRVSGFIDFGDLVYTHTICELAVAMAYAIMDKSDPLAAAVVILKHYHSVFPLEERELKVLFDLIGIRLCMSVVNSAIRKKEQPLNSYLIISEQPAWNLLRQLQDVKHQDVIDLFRTACGYSYA